ncbi:MAG TPA: hypothetical protein VHD83_23500 [Puia sp.]|nr:hypothetical protein [Puia sp.]
MTKHILCFVVATAIIAIQTSCGNSSGQGTAAKGTEAAADAPGGSGTKGAITCKLDGTPKKFEISQSFFEISLSADGQGPKDGLELLDGNNKKEGFQFEIKKSGQTKITDGARGDINCIINYYNAAGVTYTGEDVTFDVTAYDGSHLTGSFSGKLVNIAFGGSSKTANQYPQYLQITDGTFDLHK